MMPTNSLLPPPPHRTRTPPLRLRGLDGRPSGRLLTAGILTWPGSTCSPLRTGITSAGQGYRPPAHAKLGDGSTGNPSPLPLVQNWRRNRPPGPMGRGCGAVRRSWRYGVTSSICPQSPVRFVGLSAGWSLVAPPGGPPFGGVHLELTGPWSWLRPATWRLALPPGPALHVEMLGTTGAPSRCPWVARQCFGGSARDPEPWRSLRRTIGLLAMLPPPGQGCGGGGAP